MTEVEVDFYDEAFKETTTKLYFKTPDTNDIIQNGENHNHQTLCKTKGSSTMASKNDPNGYLKGKPGEELKSEMQEDNWTLSNEVLTWTSSKVASYNTAQKLFRCIECACVGLLSNIAEHWLGTHANVKIYLCLKCSYASAWMRCLRMHLARQHNICQEPNADQALQEFWKKDPALEDVTKYLERLKSKLEVLKYDLRNNDVDSEDEYEDEDVENSSSNERFSLLSDNDNPPFMTSNLTQDFNINDSITPEYNESAEFSTNANNLTDDFSSENKSSLEISTDDSIIPEFHTTDNHESEYFTTDNIGAEFFSNNLSSDFSINNNLLADFATSDFNAEFSTNSNLSAEFSAHDLSLGLPSSELNTEFSININSEPEIIPISKGYVSKYATEPNIRMQSPSFSTNSSCVDDLSCSDLFSSDLSASEFITAKINQTPDALTNTELATSMILNQISEQINDSDFLGDDNSDQTSEHSPNVLEQIKLSQFPLSIEMDITEDGRSSPELDIASVIIKRYNCEQCPYSTDRRDLFNRHENIHKMDKRYECNVCHKQFNRADHIKKHFLRLHSDHKYDLSAVKRNLYGNKMGPDAPKRTRMRPQNKILPIMKTQPVLQQVNKQEAIRNPVIQQPVSMQTNKHTAIQLLLQTTPQPNTQTPIRVSVVQQNPRQMPPLKQLTVQPPKVFVQSSTQLIPQPNTIKYTTSTITHARMQTTSSPIGSTTKITVQPEIKLATTITQQQPPMEPNKIPPIIQSVTQPIKSHTPQPSEPQNKRPLTVIVEPTTSEAYVQNSPRQIKEKAPIPNKQIKSVITERTFNCHLCEWIGIDKWSLRRHMNTHSKPYECPLCEYKAARSERLQTHVHNVHKMHVCTACNYVVKEGIELIAHQEENHKNMRTKRNKILKKINSLQPVPAKTVSSSSS